MTYSRTKAKLRNSQLQLAGDLWPVFLYASYSYDAEDPWNGLMRSGLLISVSSNYSLSFGDPHLNGTQAYKHVFTSPSSVDQEPKATRSGNARIHGMCYDRFSSPVGTENRGGSEVGEILTTAHREFGGCAHRCAGKPKRRDQDQASPRRRGRARSGTAEG